MGAHGVQIFDHRVEGDVDRIGLSIDQRLRNKSATVFQQVRAA